MTIVRRLANISIWRKSGVVSDSTPPTMALMRPSSVEAPVATTSPRLGRSRQRAGIGHRGAVAERRVRSDGVGRLVRRADFAGQRRFLDPEVRGAQEPEVGGNAVAGFDQHDVAGDQAFGRNGSRRPSRRTEPRGSAWRKSPRAIFRPAFLDEADRGVDEDDSEDDHGVESVTSKTVTSAEARRT